MQILALETSSEYCSVALWRDGDVDEDEIHAGQRHSVLLIGMVDALLKRHALRVSDLSGIAYGQGPGTFTGLRIACGVTQGLAAGAALPVVGVCTLRAMAEACGAANVVCCVDARMREVYHAGYSKAGMNWQTVHAPGVYAPDSVPLLEETGWHGCGNGFAVYGDVLRARYAGKLAAIDEKLHAHAREIAILGAAEFARGAGLDAEHAAPLYIRDKVALKTHER